MHAAAELSAQLDAAGRNNQPEVGLICFTIDKRRLTPPAFPGDLSQNEGWQCLCQPFSLLSCVNSTSCLMRCTGPSDAAGAAPMDVEQSAGQAAAAGEAPRLESQLAALDKLASAYNSARAAAAEAVAAGASHEMRAFNT